MEKQDVKLIELSDISFSYGDRTVWYNLSFNIQKGELLCLLGPNGCGKTTLLNCIHGDQTPQKGSIQLNGKSIRSMGTTKIAQKMGFVFQEHSASFPYSVMEVVLMGRGPHLGLFESPSDKDREIAVRSLKQMNILSLKEKRYTQISGGERQLVLIARTLTQEPEVILLDEPTSHLDFRNQALVLGMIRRLSRQGLTIIMTSHFPNHALVCADRVAMINNGRLVGIGKTQKIMTERNMEKTYGIGVKILSFWDEKEDREIKYCIPRLEDEALDELSEHFGQDIS